MVRMAGIVCKTIGVAGLSAAIYDAHASAKRHSKVGEQELTNDVFEQSIAAKRSNSDGSKVSSAIQKKVSDLRMDNPIVPLIGKVKGYAEGLLGSLGSNIIPVILASCALAGKGFIQKSGAWGLAILGTIKLLKEGFGIGKTSPIDK